MQLLNKLYYIFIILVILLIIPSTKINAITSEKAYQDYLYQFDVYRQKNNDFKIAKTNYEKYKTLTSSVDALDKTKLLLSQKDILLKTYLMVLLTKLEENKGLSPIDISAYKKIIDDENIFLESHSQLINSVNNLDDAENVSNDLISHYVILSAAMRQVIIMLHIGSLNLLYRDLDGLTSYLYLLVEQYRGTYPTSKQAVIDKWVMSIKDKQLVYNRNIDQIKNSILELKGNNVEGLDSKFQSVSAQINQTRQYLLDTVSYTKELLNLMQYAE